MESLIRVAAPAGADRPPLADDAANASHWKPAAAPWCRPGAMPGVLDGLSPADVRMAPFPHLVVENCLPGDLYEALAAAYPSNERVLQLGRGRRKGPIRSNQRHNVGASQILGRESLDPLWEAFARRHASAEFYRDVVRVFGPAIRATYPDLERRLGGTLGSLSTGVRFDASTQERWAVSLDCQVAINTAVTMPGSVRGVHADAPEELFAMLLYFRPEEDRTSTGGDLEVWRWKAGRRPAFVGKQAFEQDAEHVETIPYRANTLVAFVNSPQALHAVSPRGVTPHSRRLVNIIGEVDRSLPEGLFVKRQKTLGKLRQRLASLWRPG